MDDNLEDFFARISQLQYVKGHVLVVGPQLQALLQNDPQARMDPVSRVEDARAGFVGFLSIQTYTEQNVTWPVYSGALPAINFRVEARRDARVPPTEDEMHGHFWIHNSRSWLDLDTNYILAHLPPFVAPEPEPNPEPEPYTGPRPNRYELITAD